MADKLLKYDVAMKSTKTVWQMENPRCYTGDENTVTFDFNITDLEAADLVGVIPNVYLYMRDGSFFKNGPADGVEITGTIVNYTMKGNEGKHSGIARAQLVLVWDDEINPPEKLTSQLYYFDVVSGLENKVAVEVMIQDWTTLTREARTFIDTSSDEVDALKGELQTAINTANASLGEFDVALETGIVAANLAEKLEDFEEINNSRLLSTERQLADSESKRELISRKKRKVLLSFVDDDTKSTVMDRWPQIIQEKNIKMNLAVITGTVGESGSLTWQQIKDLKAMGAIPVVHCHNHIEYTTLTETELRTDIQTALSLFKANGLHSDALVYVGGAHNALVRKVTRDYFRCGVTVQSTTPENDINYPPLNQYAIRRRPLAETTYADYKAWLDLAIANNGWLVFMSHSQFAAFDATQVQAIKDLIDYARTQGVEIVTLEEGLDIYGNLLDQGDYSDANADYTIIDCEGKLHSTKINQYAYEYNTALTGNDIPTTYPKNRTKINIIDYNMRTTFPESLYGILETVTGVNYHYCRQTFSPAQKDYTFTRRAISDGTAWTPWVKVITQTELDSLPYQIKPINTYTEATLPSAFSTGVTVFPVNGDNPFNGLAGIVTNYKMGSGVDWYKQELRAYGSNQVFSRKTIGGGDTWDVWQKISAV